MASSAQITTLTAAQIAPIAKDFKIADTPEKMVRLGEAKLRVGGINCVGTLPDYRRHGLLAVRTIDGRIS